MHEPIERFPAGTVLGSCRLIRDRTTVDVTRLKYGSATRFVESVTIDGRFGARRVAWRCSDDFPSDKIANRFIGDWLTGIVANRKFRVAHMDDAFRTYTAVG